MSSLHENEYVRDRSHGQTGVRIPLRSSDIYEGDYKVPASK